MRSARSRRRAAMSPMPPHEAPCKRPGCCPAPASSWATWSGEPLMGIYEELGVTAYINANEWYTSQGGSMLAAPVIQAMSEASQRAVRLVDLQRAVDGAIAELTHNEAACVTSSATAGIVLSVAAFMSDLDPDK